MKSIAQAMLPLALLAALLGAGASPPEAATPLVHQISLPGDDDSAPGSGQAPQNGTALSNASGTPLDGCAKPRPQACSIMRGAASPARP